MRHASARGGAALRKPVIADYCTEKLGAPLVRSLLLAAVRELHAVEKPRMARKNVHRTALEELCKKARMLHSQSTEQHVEEQLFFTLRGLPEDAEMERLREYEDAVQQMTADIRAAAAREQQEQYDPVALSLPENSLRMVCNLLRTRAGEAMGPADYVLLQEFGHGACEHLEKLVLGALAQHCQRLEANIALNARAAAPMAWVACMQHERMQATARELNQLRLASPNVQQLRGLVCKLEAEVEAEAGA